MAVAVVVRPRGRAFCGDVCQALELNSDLSRGHSYNSRGWIRNGISAMI